MREQLLLMRSHIYTQDKMNKKYETDIIFMRHMSKFKCKTTDSILFNPEKYMRFILVNIQNDLDGFNRM